MNLTDALQQEIHRLSPEEQAQVLDYVHRLRQSAMSATEILARLNAHADSLRALKVAKLGLIGSYSRGEARWDSDMDFLASFEQFSLHNLGGLRALLESLFDCQIDIVLEAGLRADISAQAAREVLYVEGL